MNNVSNGRPLRAAVVGCGAISAEHLAFLARSPRAKLVGVCDASPATARFASDRFAAQSWFVDANEMLERTHPDVVHVLTPPHTHFALVMLCLEHSAHVVCEKPMTGSADDTRTLLQRAEQCGQSLVESRNLLYNDQVRAIDELIGHGAIGEVNEVDVLLCLDLAAGPFGDQNLSGPGVDLPAGAVHDFLPHLAYLFDHFAGSGVAVESVVGWLRNISGNARVGYDSLDALVSVGSRRGRLRVASDLKPESFRLVVRGTFGSVETDMYNPYMRYEGGRLVGKAAPVEQLVSGLRLAAAGFSNFANKVLQHGAYHGLPRMLEAVYAAWQAGQPPPIRPSEIVAAAELVDRLVGLAAAP